MTPNFAKKLIEVDVSKVKQIIDMTEETLDFVNYSKKRSRLRGSVKQLCNICFSFLCRNNLCPKTEQSDKNLTFYIGLIARRLEKGVLDFFYKRDIMQLFSADATIFK